MDFREPISPDDFKKYFHTRWLTLRKPLGFAKGSEIDEAENTSFHIMAIENHLIAGVGRLSVVNKNLGQIRYMGVLKEFRNQQVGKGIINSLEEEAKNKGLQSIYLNARQEAYQFYLNQGYSVEGSPFEGIAGIMHSKMVKMLR